MNSIKLFTANVKLTATEEYLLNWINDKPDLFIEYKTQEIAKAANCSTSAITRLARKLDYPSLKKMQIKAQEKMSEIKDNYQIISEIIWVLTLLTWIRTTHTPSKKLWLTLTLM
jgi:DNA-binding MurR/RpiR family transcriptional regulator